jgi:hypothetical protein
MPGKVLVEPLSAVNARDGQRPRDLGSFAAGDRDPISGVMKNLDLSDEEAAALVTRLTRIIDGERYPFSERTRTLKAIPREAQAGARSRAVAAEGLCAAASDNRP